MTPQQRSLPATEPPRDRRPVVIVPAHRWYVYNRALSAIASARYKRLSHVDIVAGDPGDWLGFRFLPCPAYSGVWQDPGGTERQAAESLVLHAEATNWFQVKG